MESNNQIGYQQLLYRILEDFEELKLKKPHAMKLTFDLQYEVIAKINSVFGSDVDTENIWLDLSIEYPENYLSIYNRWKFTNEKIMIDGFYGKYDVEKGKVIIFLNVVSEPCSLVGFQFKYFIRMVTYFLIGQYTCHHLHVGNRTFTNQSFVNTGSIFRNFIAMMIGYELMRSDDGLIDHCKQVTESLCDDMALWLTFIPKTDEKHGSLPGIPIQRILLYAKSVMQMNKVNITQDDIIEHFNDYIDQMINSNPKSINHFYPVMTASQKKNYAFLGVEYGFFED